MMYRYTKQITIVLILFLVFGLGLSLFAQNGSGKVEVLIFTNWHYNLTKDADQSNAFDFKRSYFGYKYKIKKGVRHGGYKGYQGH